MLSFIIHCFSHLWIGGELGYWSLSSTPKQLSPCNSTHGGWPTRDAPSIDAIYGALVAEDLSLLWNESYTVNKEIRLETINIDVFIDFLKQISGNRMNCFVLESVGKY